MKKILGLGLAAALAGACSGNESTPAASVALQRLEAATGSVWSLAPGDGGGVRHLAGRADGVLTADVTAERATLAFLERHKELFALADPARELRLVTTKTTPDAGLTHARFRQTVGGVEVWGKELIAHYDADGALLSISADLAPSARGVALTPRLAAEEAIARADAGDARTTFRAPRAKLVVYVDDAGAAHLAWHVELFLLPAAMPVRMIDAATGATLFGYDNLQTAAVATTVPGTNVARDIKVLQQGASWVLSDDTRTAGGIHTRNANYATQPTSSTPLVSSTSRTSGWDAAGVDAHFGASVVYDFYKSHFNRESYDGQGGALDSFVHVGDPRATTQQARRLFGNAYWDGEAMNYGDGDGAEVVKLSSGLDVCAHELTHGVTGAESQLVYQGESGALNESMSDIFATLVEHEVDPTPAHNSRIGEDVVGPSFGKDALRYMDAPGNGSPPQPASYHGRNWYSGSQDQGGVHINSGVPNNAFWIMTTAAKNPDTNIGPASSIGWSLAAKLWYTANTSYLHSTSKMSDAAQATLDAAAHLGFSQADVNIVQCAWIAVGVLTGPCKVTTGGSGATGGGTTDGGVVTPDAGKTDAGKADAGKADAGSVAADAGAPRGDAGGGGAGPAETDDAGPQPIVVVPNGGVTSAEATGCGCVTAGARGAGTLPGFAAAGLLGLVGARRRRARAAGHPAR